MAVVNAEATLQDRCAAILRDHVRSGEESTRHAAYNLGRDALAAGLGVLDMASLLYRARAELQSGNGTGHDGTGPPSWAVFEGFCLECFAPFEMAYRGAAEANAVMRAANVAREEEVKRLAHALHDEAGQLLVCVHLALDAALRESPSTDRDKFRPVKEHLQAVEERLRLLSYELRPTVLDDLGLEPALRSLADIVARRSELVIDIEGSYGGRLETTLETVIYRGVQEALRNAARHAHATRIRILLDRKPGLIYCSVTDDGVGFNPEEKRSAASGAGLGLIGIRERVASVGGNVVIASTVGGGTTLTIEIPEEKAHVASRRYRR